MFDVYNKNHEKTNIIKNKSELSNDEYTVSVFVWIMDDSNRILVQQRSSIVENWANMWGATGGSMEMGETPVQAILRELYEELGLTVLENDIQFIGSYLKYQRFAEVFLLKKNVLLENIKINESEVARVKYISVEKYRQMLEDGEAIPSGFPIFDIYYKEYISNLNV